MFWFSIGFLSALFVVGFVIRRRMRGWRRGKGRGFAARRFLAKINATPEQEVEVLDALDSLWAAGAGLRGELGEARADLAAALRADELADANARAAFDARRPALERALEAFDAAFARIFTTLDPMQRAQLAELVVAGPGRRGPGCRRGRTTA